MADNDPGLHEQDDQTAEVSHHGKTHHKHSEQGDHHHHHHRHKHHSHHHHSRHQNEQPHQKQEQVHHHHHQPHHPRRTMLIAMDGSAHSFYAFDWYMANLHTPETEVIVAHSSSHNTSSFPPVHTLMSSVRDSVAMSRAEQEEEEEVNRIVAQIKGKLTQAGVRGKLLRLTGDPGPAIVHAGVDNSATCIVTGSRGLGTVKRALIGSVSDYILHHAHCPVMVCRHKEISPKDKDSRDRSLSYS